MRQITTLKKVAFPVYKNTNNNLRLLTSTSKNKKASIQLVWRRKKEVLLIIPSMQQSKQELHRIQEVHNKSWYLPLHHAPVQYR